MSRIILWFFIGLFLSSCDDVSNEEFSGDPDVDLRSEEILVVQAILEKVKKVSPKPPPASLFRYPNETEEEFILRQGLVLDSIHAKWDTTLFIFIVEAKLHPIKFGQVEQFIDESFMVDSADIVFDDSSGLLDISRIQQSGFVVVDAEGATAIKEDSLKKITQREDFNSLLSFSKMVFNNDKTKVVFYLNQFCGLYCGSGTLYKMVKLNEGWVVEDSSLEWGG